MAVLVLRVVVAAVTALPWFTVPILIYLFLLSISLLGASMKMMGGGMAMKKPNPKMAYGGMAHKKKSK